MFQHQYFSIFFNKNKRVSLHIYCYLKIERIITTIVSFNNVYMFHISLRLKFATVVKLFPTKLKHNRSFISFITHKGALANETTSIEKSSPSSPFPFISLNEYHFLLSSYSTKYDTLSFYVRCSLFIIHFLVSLARCGVVFLYVVWIFVFLQLD